MGGRGGVPANYGKQNPRKINPKPLDNTRQSQ